MSGSQLMAPGDEDAVERGGLGQRLRRRIDVRLDETGAGRQPHLVGQRARRPDRLAREVDPATAPPLRQDQAVIAEMALQVQHPHSVDRPELGLLDLIHPLGAGPQRREIIPARREMQPDPFFPIGGVVIDKAGVVVADRGAEGACLGMDTATGCPL